MYEDLHEKEYWVCYFDVLGQKNAMGEYFRNGSEITAEAQGRIDEVSELLRRMYGDIKGLIEQMLCSPDELYDVLSKEEGSSVVDWTRERFAEEIKKIEWGIQQFSDSTILYVETGRVISGTIFFYFLLAVSKAMPLLHSLGICMRGAIGVGRAWKVPNGQLCGSVLDEVDALESCVAYYSRIVFSGGAVARIRDLSKRMAVGEKGDRGVACLSGLMCKEYDGCVSLNYFSRCVVEWIRGQDDLGSFLAFAQKAKEMIDAAALNLRSQVSGKDLIKTASIGLKYQFLHAFYEERWKKLEEARGSAKTLKACGKPNYQRTSVGAYFVLYIQVEPLPTMSGGVVQGGVRVPVKTCEMTIHMVRSIKDALHRASDVWTQNPRKIWRDYYNGRVNGAREEVVVEKCERLHVGFQQLSRNIMVYVRDDNDMALSHFVYLLFCMAPAVLPTFGGDHLLSAAAAYRRGWELFDNCIQGPVVWDAYRLCAEANAYPRIAMSSDLVQKMRKDLEAGSVWGKITDQLVQDVDGFWCWHYLSPTTVTNFMALSGGKIGFGEFYKAAYSSVIRRRIALSSNGDSVKESSALCRKLLLLEQYLVRYGLALGFEEEIEFSRQNV